MLCSKILKQSYGSSLIEILAELDSAIRVVISLFCCPRLFSKCVRKECSSMQYPTGMETACVHERVHSSEIFRKEFMRSQTRTSAHQIRAKNGCHAPSLFQLLTATNLITWMCVSILSCSPKGSRVIQVSSDDKTYVHMQRPQLKTFVNNCSQIKSLILFSLCKWSDRRRCMMLCCHQFHIMILHKCSVFVGLFV